jgi:hypothetical protein
MNKLTGGYVCRYKVCIPPTHPHYQTIVDRCIASQSPEVFDIYSDGDLYLDWFVAEVELERVKIQKE